jgi:outer membrane receptor protein involved in Fe transport
MSERQRLSVVAAVAAALASATAANAQTPPSGDQQSATARKSGTILEEVIVTARKKEESTLDTPVAVTVVTGEQLDRFNVKGIEQLAETTPELMVVRGNSGSGATLSIRGVGNNFTSNAIEQSVAVIVDGVYYSQGRVINEAFFDMARAEILKGPQALFFGKNATAGVLSLTTKGPTDGFEADSTVSYEFETATTSIEGAVSLPVTDKLGLRLALRGSLMDGGYVENHAGAVPFTMFDIATSTLTTYTTLDPELHNPQQEDLVGRVSLDYQATDQLAFGLKLSGTRSRANNPTWNNELFFCESGFSQVNPAENCKGDWQFRNNAMPREVAEDNKLMDRHGGELYQDYDSHSVTATAEYTGDSATFTSVNGYHTFTNYFLGDYDGTEVTNGGTWGSERSEYSAFSSENRVQTTFDSPFNVMGGIYYQTTELDFLQDVIFPAGPTGSPGLADSSVSDPSTRNLILRKASQADGETLAGFAQVTWAFSDDWELAAGARYTHETKDSYFHQPYVVAPFIGFFVPDDKLRGDQTFTNTSPEATLKWSINPDMTAYIAYKEGFKSGGFSGSGIYSGGTTADDLEFDPETVQGEEAGLKMSLFDRQLRLDVGIFNYEYSDIQVDFFDTTKFSFTTFNAGKVTSRGAEFAVGWAPLQVAGLEFNGSLAYLHARYKDFADAPCYAGQTPAEGCVILDRPTQDVSGKATALAPEWSGTLRADYEAELTDGYIFGISGNIRYSDEYFLNPLANPNSMQDAFATYDAALRFGPDDRSWEVALVGKNLTNEYVVNGSYDSPNSGAGTGTDAGVHADQMGFISTPRTIALQVTAHF